jgi:polar amino acid transport system permease protein
LIYEFQFADVWRNFGALMWGAWLTVRLSGLSMILGLALAIACNAWRALNPRIAAPVVDFYVELIRNTPFLVQVFLVFFGLPSAGIKLGANQAAIIAMVLNVGAYASEIVRAGIDSIAAGQVDAGLALGLRRHQIFRLIILLPAVQAVYPSLTSQFLLLMLTSSVLSVISAEELTAIADNIASQSFRNIEVYIVVAGIYLFLSLAFAAVFALAGRLLFRGHYAVLGRRGPN